MALSEDMNFNIFWKKANISKVYWSKSLIPHNLQEKKPKKVINAPYSFPILSYFKVFKMFYPNDTVNTG